MVTLKYRNGSGRKAKGYYLVPQTKGDRQAFIALGLVAFMDKALEERLARQLQSRLKTYILAATRDICTVKGE